ncbi:MAG: methyltransferase type 11 [Mycobacterium sp.]|nr:methyltransferase type 11 [Mycobacterium sp.]
MIKAHDLRSRLVDSSGSVGAKMRLRRWQLFEQLFPKLEAMSVLDLGGRLESWTRAPLRPAYVHVVNLEDPPDELPDWATAERADVCELSDDFSRRHFDLVFSNSLIEHVGGHYRREQLATVVRRSAQQYWVQTPYRYFPVEPHFLFPGFQFMPATARAGVARRWPLLHTPSSDRTNAVSTVLSTELIGRTEMKFYFPDSVIYSERIAGVTKSLIAVKR